MSMLDVDLAGSPRVTSTTAIAAITIESRASSRKIRQKRCIIEWRGLGRRIGLRARLPFGRAKWDYQAEQAASHGRRRP